MRYSSRGMRSAYPRPESASVPVALSACVIGMKGFCTQGWALIPADEDPHEFLVRRRIDDSEPPVRSPKGTHSCRPSGGIRMVIRMIITDDGARVPAQQQVSWSAAGIGCSETPPRGTCRRK